MDQGQSACTIADAAGVEPGSTPPPWVIVPKLEIITMNNQLIIDMIKTLASHLSEYGHADLQDALNLTIPYNIEDHFEFVNEAACYRVFGSINADEPDIHREMVEYLNNEGYDVISWNNVDDIERAASALDGYVDGYYVFEHQEDGGHLREMASMLAECNYMHNAPMYDRLQAFNLSPDDTKLHELVAFQGHMVLPTVDRYLEDPTGSDEWERDFRDALDHFWSGQGSERQSEKVKFIMNWLADQV